MLGYTEVMGVAQYDLGTTGYRVGAGFTLDRNSVRPISAISVHEPLSDDVKGFVKVKLDGFASRGVKNTYFESSIMFGVESFTGAL